MGMFDFLSQKGEQPKKAEKKTVVQPRQMFQTPQTLNNRGHIRYYVDNVPAGTLGVIVDISRGGCRIKKGATDPFDFPDVKFRLGTGEVHAKIAWQDENYMGLEIGGGFEDAAFISKHLKRIKEDVFRPIRRLSEDTIKGFIAKDPFSLLINLIAELESQNTDMNKLKSLIIKLPGLAPDVAIKAGITKSEEDLELKDVDHAVKRLGIDAVKKAAVEFIKAKGNALESAQPKNDLHESLKVLKKVFFDVLAPFFGFKDNTGLVDNLASFEYKGIDVIIAKSEGIPRIKEFYNTPTKIYSEMARFCERLNFGRDVLNINRLYIVNMRKTLAGLYDGYLLANMALNPVYTLDPDIKLSLNKINLNFSYITYLTFLAAQAIIEKDPGAAAIFMARLHGTGMDSGKLNSFVQNYVGEINRIMGDLGRSAALKVPAPAGAFKFADYVPLEDIPQYGKFLKPFRELETIKRIVISYEDEAYTHFMIGKILLAEDIGLNTKMYCVVPCENLSTDEIQAEMFSFFSVVVLKNIDKLNKNLLRVFVKMWNSFDGCIIATFSKYSMVDFNSRDLYVLLRKHIVDFPSYFDGERVYHKMLDHTAAYMRPYTDGVSMNVSKYQEGVYSMNHVRGSELLNTAPEDKDGEEDKKKSEINPRFRV
ncbi:MAG: hypothetical protein HQL01_10725 [Nitrospirae bacterium]|nr:hypothetical protein [Nitrospirota bacterium]